MGWCETNWHHFTHVTFSCFFILVFSTQIIHGLFSYDPESLDSIIRDYAMEALVHHHTGTLINVSLPSNYSGINAKVLTIRSATLREKGANLSSFDIPPRVMPFPFVKRVAMVYQNLGNWSYSYYKVPGYSLVAPVIGLVSYNASSLKALGNESLRLSVLGEPIYVSFPSVVVGKSKETPKCVKFIEGGLVQFSNLTQNKICIAQGDGHFSVAVPVKLKENNKFKNWRWWVLGFVVGFVGLILLGVIGIMAFKLVKSERVKKMIGDSENGVAFDTSLVMGARMPSASMVRTQPELEHRDIP